MKYFSVCDGIGAVHIWHEVLGWECVGTSEIAPFPAAVVEQRYGFKNYGDFTKIDRCAELADLDVLVGGTPCQSFSVAGNRGGVDDARGNLTLEFIKLAGRLKPKYVVWENVPGVLSIDDNQTIQQILDLFTQIGYCCDIDILDAQYMGVPQRRRRVFITCVRLDALLAKKTDLSARIAGELLLQPLQNTWTAILQASYPEKSISECTPQIERFANSAKKRIGLLEKALGASVCTTFRGSLNASQAQSMDGRDFSDSISTPHSEVQIEGLKVAMRGCRLLSMGSVCGCKSIDILWKNILDALSQKPSGFTTSTIGDLITESAIYIFAHQSLSIAESIIGSVDSSKNTLKSWSKDYWNLASLLLATIGEITTYARLASSDLFSESGLSGYWRNYIERADRSKNITQRHIGNWTSSAAILPLSQSLSGDSPPRKETRQDIAATLTSGTGSGRCNKAGRRQEEDSNIVAGTMPARSSGGGGPGAGTDEACSGYLVFDPTQITSKTNQSRCEPGAPCHTLAKGQHPPTIAPTLDASYATKQGLDNQHINSGGVSSSVAMCLTQGGRFDAETETLVTHTLKGNGHDGSEDGTGRGVPLVTAMSGRWRGAEKKVGREARAPHTCEDRTGALDATKPWSVTAKSGVRRLTPRECERLQGFKDDHTLITYRKKPAADAPRYEGVGNSMARPCMLWIGQRIEIVDALK